MDLSSKVGQHLQLHDSYDRASKVGLQGACSVLCTGAHTEACRVACTEDVDRGMWNVCMWGMGSCGICMRGLSDSGVGTGRHGWHEFARIQKVQRGTREPGWRVLRCTYSIGRFRKKV